MNLDHTQEILMSGTVKKKNDTRYRIIVDGVLNEKWNHWFEGFIVTPIEDKQTALVGAVPDQAALHGVFAKIRDLGLTLISVQQICHQED